MSFIWPAVLFSLLLVPLAVILYVRMQQRRRQMAARYGSLGSMQSAAGRPGLRRHIPPAIFLTGLVILTVAMARPQTVVNLPKIEGTVMLVFDVSGSMAADDFKPTRMDAAKSAARDFVERQPSSVQIGVIAFSDAGMAVQAPTYDKDAILSAINRLSPQRGTSLASGISAALVAITKNAAPNPALEGEPEHLTNLAPQPTPSPTPFPKGEYTNAVIVILSDGENNQPPDPAAAAQLAADRGVRIYTVGIGSAAGITLHINGFTVLTQLNEALLKQTAQLTGGAYFNAASEQELQQIYANLNPQWVIKPEKIEVTSLFAGASILVFIIGGVFSLLWFNRLP
jgi:Ca-activated chloride channel family protein